MSAPEKTWGSLWERYWFGPVRAIRPWLLVRGLMLLLALDVWLLMLVRGARYGAGRFNVPHFEWMAAWQPTPTPAFYVGLLLGVSWMAALVALGATHAVLRWAICVGYTFAWAMSMTDSYQHHYLLSIVLFCVALIPDACLRLNLWGEPPQGTPAKDGGSATSEPSASSGEAGVSAPSGTFDTSVTSQAGPLVSAWGYSLLAVCIGVVYLFTAATKSDASWRTGQPLQMMFSHLSPFVDFQRQLAVWGVESARFWHAVASGAIVLQMWLAIAYLWSVRRDNAEGWGVSIWAAGAWLGALGFHGYIAWSGALDIGWFGFYMMGLATLFFLPAAWLWHVARVLGWLPRKLIALWHSLLAPDAKPGELSSFWRWVVISMAACVSLFLVEGGKILDLPGAQVASWCMVGILWLGVVRWIWRASDAVHAWRWVGSVALGSLLLWGVLSNSSVHFNFYRFWGGDLMRRGHYESSLRMYQKAERYAPLGQSRKRTIARLQFILKQKRLPNGHEWR